MRNFVKELVEKTLVGCGAHVLARRCHRGRTVVLAYHNIVPYGEAPWGDKSLHLPQEVFSRQLDLLSDTHEIVALSSLLDQTAVASGERSEVRAAITFDDAYRGTITAGIEEVRSRSLPATVFVTPRLLGERAFWWDVLATESTGGLTDDTREHALTTLEGRQDDILRWAHAEHFSQHDAIPEHARPATPELIESLAAEPDVTLASHGWSHLNLAAVSPAEIVEEISKPLEWFSRRDLPFEPWLAYPYGRHTASVRKKARDVYSLALTTSGQFASDIYYEWWDPMQIPRANVPSGLSLDGFRLLTSGALRPFLR